ncbi:MAG: Tn3 family transposase [Massilia sp.]
MSRSIQSAHAPASLFALPRGEDDLQRHYTFDAEDRALIGRRRGDANRLGYAVQLALLQHPGVAMGPDMPIPGAVIDWIAGQVGVDPAAWTRYGLREETRREHAIELRAYLGLSAFGLAHFRYLVRSLAEFAVRTDQPQRMAEQAIAALRQRRVILPAPSVIERACANALALANRRRWRGVTRALGDAQRRQLDRLLQLKSDSNLTWLSWLRQSPLKPNPPSMLEHIARLQALRALELPDDIGRGSNQDQLRKLAAEGAHLPAADLAKLDSERRHATLLALVQERTASITDEIIDQHDAMLTGLLPGPTADDKQAVAAIVSWQRLGNDATNRLALRASLDHPRFVREQFRSLRRYTPALLDVLALHARPARRELLGAIKSVRRMNAGNLLNVPPFAPVGFIRPQWKALVVGEHGIDRRLYEMCVLHELKDALRAGDLWIEGSRRFRKFNDYLVPARTFEALKRANALPLDIDTSCERYLHDRLALLEQRLAQIDRLATAGALPGVAIGAAGLRIAAPDTTLSEAARARIAQAVLYLPRIKITDLLMEVDEWTAFTSHFVRLKDGKPAGDKALLLSVILADGIDLSLNKMAGACRETTYARLAWLQAGHMREDSYGAALAALARFPLTPESAPRPDIGLRGEEHCSDHAFALMHLLGARFAPQLGGIDDVQLAMPCTDDDYPALKAQLAGALDLRPIRRHWNDILRLATSIRQGSLTAAQVLQKFGCQSRQDSLAIALRELGRLERSLYTLDWLQQPGLRARVQAALDREAACDALARTVFGSRSAGVCEQAFAQQRQRASALNLVTAAIMLWNAVHLKRAMAALRDDAPRIDDQLLYSLLPPLSAHIDLTGAYAWGLKNA